MHTRWNSLWIWAGLCVGLCSPVFATVQITQFAMSKTSPQTIGTSIIFVGEATDSNPGPLTFQFNVAPPGGSLALVKDFNVGVLSSGVWYSQGFNWFPTGIEGTYQIQVVAKDFTSGESTSQTISYTINPLVTGSTPVVVSTANTLVALFSAPSCPAGSAMRVSFQQQSQATPATTTNYVKCHPPNTMTYEIAGMYPSTAYNMYSQTDTGGVVTNGPTVTFTTGALPTGTAVPIPTFTTGIPPGAHTDKVEKMLLLDPIQFGGEPFYADVAADLSGNVMWYYYALPPQSIILTRPLQGGGMLTIQSGAVWNTVTTKSQLLRQIDLAGHIVRETNTGIIQQELLALGATDAGPCSAIASPPPVGAACLGAFHHESIQTLPNGQTALLADIEKIFPADTQNSNTLPVDIVGDIIIILDTNWQVVWYFDTFQHDGGAPQLSIDRAAVLGETCSANQQGCPHIFLVGSSQIEPKANDWLHANSLYYWPQEGDIIWSSRNQDWVMKIDYKNGKGTGNILWRMGVGGDFTFNNVNNDPYPWFSHQHDVGLEKKGAGPMSLFDNGDTRVAQNGGDNRGMALTVDESTMQVTPVLSQSLGVYAPADGSAQLLSNGDYFFLPATVLVGLSNQYSYSIEIFPTAGTVNGTQVLNIQGANSYRAWQMPNLYEPPTT